MTKNNAAKAAEQAIKAAIRKAYDDGYNDAKMAPDNCSTYCVERAVRLDSAALQSALRAPVADEDDQPTAPDDDAIAECWVTASDCDGIAYDGPSFERGYRMGEIAERDRAALASAPVADEREPLPCPFCGGRAFATYKTDEDDIRWHSVHCRTECRGYGKHGSEKDAIAAWNTRTTLLRKYPNDEEIIDLAVEPLGIDCDRMPHGVVVFARNLLSRYAAPQASEAVRDAGDVALPLFPKGHARNSDVHPDSYAYDKWQLADYARAAILADRQRGADPIIGHITVKGKGRSSVALDASHADLPEGEYVIRAALSAQPAQKEQAMPSWLDGGADAVALAREDGLLPALPGAATGDAKP